MRNLIFTLISLQFFYGHAFLLPQMSVDNHQDVPSKELEIQWNRNIEFLGYALHIGDPPKVTSEHPIRQRLDQQAQEYGTEASLYKLFELGAELPYPFFIELMLRIEELPMENTVDLPEVFLAKYELDNPEGRALVKNIIEQANSFYLASGFETFWKKSQPEYEKALDQLKKIAQGQNWIPGLESFYQQSFNGYTLIPSLTIWPGAGFGIHIKSGGNDTAYMVMGPLEHSYSFSDTNQLKSLLIHEFGHSLVEDTLLGISRDLIDNTAHLYEPVANAMQNEGYQDWMTCVNEHLVRTGEILVPELIDGENDLAEEQLKYHVEDKQFIYLPFILERIRKYRLQENRSYEETIVRTMTELAENYSSKK